jgi:hypothetical protein
MSAPDLTAQRFWEGFDAARAEARAQTPLAAALEEYFASAPFKAAIVGIIKASFEDGVSAERARVAAILNAPGAQTFSEIAMDLCLGSATSAQAVGVLERAQADAATRAGAIRSNMLEAIASTHH